MVPVYAIICLPTLQQLQSTSLTGAPFMAAVLLLFALTLLQFL